jgi:hypothetical protein
VNTYDPAGCICYVHLARDGDPSSASAERGHTHTRLLPGYANRSSRTCLAVRPGAPEDPRRRARRTG